MHEKIEDIKCAIELENDTRFHKNSNHANIRFHYTYVNDYLSKKVIRIVKFSNNDPCILNYKNGLQVCLPNPLEKFYQFERFRPMISMH